MILAVLGALAGATDRGDALVDEATFIVESLGGRPAGSPAGDRAQLWARDTLNAAGWEVLQVAGADGYTVGCREGEQPRTVLFIAHTDTVHADVVGANDNAAAMAVLAAVARALPGSPPTPRTVCLAFPDGEEIGLVGSHRLHTDRDGVFAHPLDQVMALDLVGRGELAHNGLGPPWTAARLRALLEAAPAAVPWVYRAISHGRPDFERSDHHWFGRGGIPSSHLMARAESGVLWPYHTTADTPDSLEPPTLAAAYDAVWGVANAPPLPEGISGRLAVVVPFTSVVLPGALVVASMVLCCALAVAGRVRASEPEPLRKQLGDVALLALTMTLGAAGGLALASGGRPFGFALASPVALAGWSGLLAGAAARGVEGSLGTTLVVVGFGVLGLGLVGVGLPLLAVPVLVAAAASAWLDRVPVPGQIALAVVALWPALYLVRGDAIRELAHHHIVPAWVFVWTILLVALGGPLVVAVARASWRLRQGLLVLSLAVLVGAVAWAWTTPVMMAPWERGPAYLRPDRPPVSPVW